MVKLARGGTALINALPALDTLQLTGDEKTGVDIPRRAMEEPLRQIAFNAGAEGSVSHVIANPLYWRTYGGRKPSTMASRGIPASTNSLATPGDVPSC